MVNSGIVKEVVNVWNFLLLINDLCNDFLV